MRELPGRPTGGALHDTPIEAVFARDALRMAIATERSGLAFYTRASKLAKDARGREVFERLAERREGTSGHARGALSRARRAGPAPRIAADVSVFQGRGERACFRPAREELAKKGVDDRQALLIGIRCERGSHKFFKTLRRTLRRV